MDVSPRMDTARPGTVDEAEALEEIEEARARDDAGALYGHPDVSQAYDAAGMLGDVHASRRRRARALGRRGA